MEQGSKTLLINEVTSTSSWAQFS